MPGAKGSVIIDRFFSNSCQTNAMQENLREETRDFNKNSRQVLAWLILFDYSIYIENNTWARVDIEFLFECWTR